MFAICQDYYRCGGERRMIVKMMSICFTWFPISGLGKPKLYHDLGVFYKNRGDCGGYLTVKNYWGLFTGDDGVCFGWKDSVRLESLVCPLVD